MKIQCTSCGGEYESTEKMCPYCGTENREAAGREMKHILNGYDVQAKEMETTVPKKHVKKWSRTLLALGLVILLLLLAGCVAAVIRGKADSAAEAGKSSRDMAKMEEYYEKEDYGGMREYRRKHDLYGYEYDKYEELLDVVMHSDSCRDALESYEQTDDKENYGAFLLEDVWYYGQKAFEEGLDAALDTNFTGNEERIEAYLEELGKTLKEHGLSEDTIQLLKAGGDDNKEQFLTEARESLKK